MSFFTTSETTGAVTKIKDTGSKEILKSLSSTLKKAKKTTADDELIKLIDALASFTTASKEMYSPNIMRFMTSRDSYIKDLVALAIKIEEVDLLNANTAATSLNPTAENVELLHTMLISLIAFQQRNHEKQNRITNGKGDMVENTTHDIMQKRMNKNFNDVAEMVTPLITTLKNKLTKSETHETARP